MSTDTSPIEIPVPEHDRTGVHSVDLVCVDCGRVGTRDYEEVWSRTPDDIEFAEFRCAHRDACERRSRTRAAGAEESAEPGPAPDVVGDPTCDQCGDPATGGATGGGHPTAWWCETHEPDEYGGQRLVDIEFAERAESEAPTEPDQPTGPARFDLAAWVALRLTTNVDVFERCWLIRSDISPDELGGVHGVLTAYQPLNVDAHEELVEFILTITRPKIGVR